MAGPQADIVRQPFVIANLAAKPTPRYRDRLATETADHLEQSTRGRRAVKIRKTYVIVAISLVMLVSANIVYRKYVSSPKIAGCGPKLSQRPLTEIPFGEDFEAFNPLRWNLPESGYTPSGGRLYVEAAQSVAYPKERNYRNFEMSFNLQLTTVGAAWAVRVVDSANYYLFYLTGPEAQPANHFSVYVVCNNQIVAEKTESIPLAVRITPGVEYEVRVTARGNIIENSIIPTKGGEAGDEIPLFSFLDPDDTFPSGSIGFRTIGSDRFWIDDLIVRPQK